MGSRRWSRPGLGPEQPELGTTEPGERNWHRNDLVVQEEQCAKENQGQGRQGDRDSGSFKDRDNYRRQGGWTAINKVEIMVNNGNMQTRPLPLDRSIRSQCRNSTNVGLATKAVKRIHSQLTWFRI